MFFSEPAADGPTVAVPSAFTTVAVAVGVGVTVAARRLSRSRSSTWPTRPSLFVR